jgi:uncharacterized protein CbrC (UPF0167 family)
MHPQGVLRFGRVTVPEFPYHPDPRATGFVEASDARCASCGQRRGFIYTGPVYAVDELIDCLCPWCIEDGSAAEKFEAEFTDIGWGVPADVPHAVVQDVATRTPGFAGWQQEHWLYHCSDAAAFLGRVGWEELQLHEDAVESLLREHDEHGSTASEGQSYLASLSKDGEATAYLFRCRHCGRYLAYSDSA